jgi:tRNA-splicing ligase RtcB
MTRYEQIKTDGVPIKAWVRGVLLDEKAVQQLKNTASLPIVHKWVAAMPDVHWGIGATVGSVVPTVSAIIPAAVGVDIGCGMMAVKTSMNARVLPDDLRSLRGAIERVVPHGRTDRGGKRDRGSHSRLPPLAEKHWKKLRPGYQEIIQKHPKLDRGRHVEHLGTLGTGNHFIEICLDENEDVWVMLHSGSRGVGNRIGMHFIQLAKKDMRAHIKNLPDADLAYFEEGAEHFDDYVFAVEWAQRYARLNREIMMTHILDALRRLKALPSFQADLMAVNCHHNYVAREEHYGKEVFVTRKGAVRARLGDLGIIPGSMGAQSFIVRGLGNAESFASCSHGAGRAVSRNEAKRRFTLDDHVKATEGIECRKDAGVLDETPAAYKNINKVMEAQSDLVEIVHTLRQIVCVQG